MFKCILLCFVVPCLTLLPFIICCDPELCILVLWNKANVLTLYIPTEHNCSIFTLGTESDVLSIWNRWSCSFLSKFCSLVAVFEKINDRASNSELILLKSISCVSKPCCSLFLCTLNFHCYFIIKNTYMVHLLLFD